MKEASAPLTKPPCWRAGDLTVNNYGTSGIRLMPTLWEGGGRRGKGLGRDAEAARCARGGGQARLGTCALSTRLFLSSKCSRNVSFVYI